MPVFLERVELGGGTSEAGSDWNYPSKICKIIQNHVYRQRPGIYM